MKIYKYSLNLDVDVFEIELPKKHQVLSVTTINNRPFIYATVDENSRDEPVKVTFVSIGTGDQIPSSYSKVVNKFLGTVVITTSEKPYVWHVFYKDHYNLERLLLPHEESPRFKCPDCGTDMDEFWNAISGLRFECPKCGKREW